MFICEEEAKTLSVYLDPDHTDTISQDTFHSKLNYMLYSSRLSDTTSMTLTSRARFIQICFDMWTKKKEKEKQKLIEVFHQFDENGDGVLELREFEVLMRHFD